MSEIRDAQGIATLNIAAHRGQYLVAVTLFNRSGMSLGMRTAIRVKKSETIQEVIKRLEAVAKTPSMGMCGAK